MVNQEIQIVWSITKNEKVINKRKVLLLLVNIKFSMDINKSKRNLVNSRN